ncbi:hypothetical protein EMPG_10773 [Blastomyces silverae]|uniref:Uncharacterized protein n=1 Tax=Blastomyces silverae TaxID=2060906 RepID=A0A0H1B373_9EURO|nr:hypothetical protein EMPG_10773 [Blastomyces silverae]
MQKGSKIGILERRSFPRRGSVLGVLADCRSPALPFEIRIFQYPLQNKAMRWEWRDGWEQPHHVNIIRTIPVGAEAFCSVTNSRCLTGTEVRTNGEWPYHWQVSNPPEMVNLSVYFQPWP